LIAALAGFTLQHRLYEDHAELLWRGRRDADALPVLVFNAPALQLEHAWALRELLDPAWAAMPLALLAGPLESSLVLSDSGADPLQLSISPMATAQALRLASAIALALSQLHRRDLVHQDLTAAHILVDPVSGQVRLSGFGRAARTGLPDPGGPSAHSDLRALGAMLVQMLSGLPLAAPVPAPERLQEAPLDPVCLSSSCSRRAPSKVTKAPARCTRTCSIACACWASRGP
jgi:hypothetical protein